jgi:hypothetical protein
VRDALGASASLRLCVEKLNVKRALPAWFRLRWVGARQSRSRNAIAPVLAAPGCVPTCVPRCIESFLGSVILNGEKKFFVNDLPRAKPLEFVGVGFN